MLILAIDTTAVTASAAVAEYENGAVKNYALTSVNNGLTHSETLFPIIDNTLKAFGKKIEDVGLFAVSVGPGSFTGVRIGVAAIKGLAYTGKPVAAVSALEALAENIGAHGLICPLMDARRGVFYTAFFERRGGLLKRLTPDRASDAEEIIDFAKAYDKVYICGDGTQAFRREAKENEISPSFIIPSLAECQQNALSVALCGGRMYDEGKVCTAASVAPVYLRKPQAEREREAKGQK